MISVRQDISVVDEKPILTIQAVGEYDIELLKTLIKRGHNVSDGELRTQEILKFIDRILGINGLTPHTPLV